MRHGRPDRSDLEWHGQYSDGRWSEEGWRRCHSQMVWQAMVAVLMALAIERAAMDAGFVDGCGWGRLLSKRGVR